RRRRPGERRLDFDVSRSLGGLALMATAPDVTSALDATGRRFAFRPAALLGTISLLVTISERGELERIFWPSADHGQHLGELRMGVERDGETLWLAHAPGLWGQRNSWGA